MKVRNRTNRRQRDRDRYSDRLKDRIKTCMWMGGEGGRKNKGVFRLKRKLEVYVPRAWVVFRVDDGTLHISHSRDDVCHQKCLQ